MRTRAAYGVVLGLLGLVGACGSGTEVETFYPLTSGRNWSYVLLLRQGAEADARTVETSSRVTNLPPQTFQAATVTPQQTQAFGQTQVRLIRASAEGVAEVAMQPDPAGNPLPRVPQLYFAPAAADGGKLAIHLAVESVLADHLNPDDENRRPDRWQDQPSRWRV